MSIKLYNTINTVKNKKKRKTFEGLHCYSKYLYYFIKHFRCTSIVSGAIIEFCDFWKLDLIPLNLN